MQLDDDQIISLFDELIDRSPTAATWPKIQKVCTKGMSHAPTLSEIPDGMNRYIDELGLSTRSRNALPKANVHRLNDLVLKTEAELREVRNLGKQSISEIKQVLSTMGLNLAIPPRATRQRFPNRATGLLSAGLERSQSSRFRGGQMASQWS